MIPLVHLDAEGAAPLDGGWQRCALVVSGPTSAPPAVGAGRWEAVSYQRGFALADTAGWWSIDLGPLAGTVEVRLNGEMLTAGDGTVASSLLDATPAVHGGGNLLEVVVATALATDQPPSPAPGTSRLPLTLRRHGPVVVSDIFVHPDPDDLCLSVTLENRSDAQARGYVAGDAGGRSHRHPLRMEAGQRITHLLPLGATGAARWRPSAPVLHEAEVTFTIGPVVSDRRRVRFGLRTVEVARPRCLVVPPRRGDALDVVHERAEAEQEVRGARALGFTMLQVWMPPAGATFLDVCDELGMLVRCHLAVPPAGDLGLTETGTDRTAGGLPERPGTVRRVVQDVTSRIVHHRNHPSVVSWSVTGAPLDGRPSAPLPGWLGDTVAAAAQRADPTRPMVAATSPVVEVDARRGMRARLEVERARSRDDPGGYCVLAATPPLTARGIAASGSMAAQLAVANHPVLPALGVVGLVAIQAEMVRAPLVIANDGPALAEVDVEARFCARTVPALRPPAASGGRGAEPPRSQEWRTWLGWLPACRSTTAGTVAVPAPGVPGDHQLVVRVHARGALVAELRYPFTIVAPPDVGGLAVRVLGASGTTVGALGVIGARVGATGTAVVGEGALTSEVARSVCGLLAAGEVVVVLAQDAPASSTSPLRLAFHPVGTGVGAGVVCRTTGTGALASLPRRAVLDAQDWALPLDAVVRAVGDSPGPDTVVVEGDDPAGGGPAAAVVASHGFGDGRLVLCQYQLCGLAARGDPGARALLGDVLGWATAARPVLRHEQALMPDGRRVARYRHDRGLAR